MVILLTEKKNTTLRLCTCTLSVNTTASFFPNKINKKEKKNLHLARRPMLQYEGHFVSRDMNTDNSYVRKYIASCAFKLKTTLRHNTNRGNLLLWLETLQAVRLQCITSHWVHFIKL